MRRDDEDSKKADQGGALHDGLLSPILSGHGELREVHEYLCHLIPALTAAHVHDAIAVAVLGERLRDDCLAAAEGSWDGAGSCIANLSLRYTYICASDTGSKCLQQAGAA